MSRSALEYQPCNNMLDTSHIVLAVFLDICLRSDRGSYSLWPWHMSIFAHNPSCCLVSTISSGGRVHTAFTGNANVHALQMMTTAPDNACTRRHGFYLVLHIQPSFIRPNDLFRNGGPYSYLLSVKIDSSTSLLWSPLLGYPVRATFWSHSSAS